MVGDQKEINDTLPGDSGSGTFYAVGVGPGDPELITLKARRILENCNFWLCPAARENGQSSALRIASTIINVEKKNILTHHFPMKHVVRGQQADPELLKAWQAAARQVMTHLKRGEDVAFPTLGDPALYSTAYYLYETLVEEAGHINVEFVPGVSAIGATASAAHQPLCLGNEYLAVIPATFDDRRLKQALEDFDSIALMKVHRILPQLIGLLDELQLTEKAILVEKTSLEDQRVWYNIKEAIDKPLHYFSTIIIRKNQ